MFGILTKMLPSPVRKYSRLVLPLSTLLVGVGIGWGLTSWTQSHTSITRPLRQSSIPSALSEYRYIDPLIGSGGASDSLKHDRLEHEITAYLTAQKKERTHYCKRALP